MQECRKEMPVEDDYMMVIIPCIAEIAVSDTPERVKKLRLGAVSELQRYLHYYRQLGYMPKLLYAIADKKCRMIGLRHNQGGDAKASPPQLSAL